MANHPVEGDIPSADRLPYDFTPLFQTQRAMFSVAGTDGLLRDINPAFERLIGRSRHELLGRSIFEFIAPQDIPLTLQGLSEMEEGDEDVTFENRWQHADGTFRNVEWIAKGDRLAHLWYATARDVTESRRTQDALRKVQERLTLALSVAQAGSWEYSVSEDQIYLDSGAEVLANLPALNRARSFRSMLKIVHQKDRRRFLKEVRDLSEDQETLQTDFRLKDEKTGTRHLALRGRVVSRDRRKIPLQAIGIAFDITNQKALEEQLLAMVMFDPLTAIRNRRSFDQVLRTEWKRAAKLKRPIGVLMIDVDQFKLYNDHQGHQAGDEVLCAVASTLAESLLRSEDLVARYGGEEFVVLLPGVSIEQVVLVGERLRDAVCMQNIPHAHSAAGKVTVSIGAASSMPDENLTPKDVLSAADAALYRAKAAGRNCVKT